MYVNDRRLLCEVWPKGCDQDPRRTQLFVRRSWTKMMCESRGLGPACHTGSLYYNVADTGSLSLLTFLENAGQGSPSFPAIDGMTQDFQQFGAMNGNLVPQVDSSNYSMKPRELWWFGLQSDVAKEWSYLLN